ncbi:MULTISPECIES: protein translocase subunit SecF [Clostridium]|uniref:Protein-export membrane protein SecF n=1 Tax=Clostridium cibarium TaxID=2762247 RepID=A0ABR8PTK9_9CLOT|nr:MULTISPECIES: protein translocase subunit SecF [Clostridium]MBD7911510.1 protein translocase subunit SecF [Clostridium cibarium]
MLKIIEKTKIWFALSLTVILIGIGFMVFRGLNFGIDFKGGTEILIQMKDDFNKQEADDIAKKYTEDLVSNVVDGNKYKVKSSNLDSQHVSDLVNELKEKYELDDNPLVSQNEIGASVGNDLKKNSFISLSIALVAMLIYIAIRFEFKFGIASVIALAHDVLVTLSVYAIFDIQINTPFIAAMLTIVGYSMNDTIVIFDRIREISRGNRRKDVVEIADVSLTQTIERSINTTLATLLTIIAINILVPSVRDFAFPLVVGIATGAYSSIFIASPVWVILKKKMKRKVVAE